MTPCSYVLLPRALSTSSSHVYTALNQLRALVLSKPHKPQACTTCFHAPEVGHHQHHAHTSLSPKSSPSSALTDIPVDPSDYPVRPSQKISDCNNAPPCVMTSLAHLNALLDALCLHDPVTTRSRFFRTLYARLLSFVVHTPSTFRELDPSEKTIPADLTLIDTFCRIFS